jgi:hypothetical protein
LFQNDFNYSGLSSIRFMMSDKLVLAHKGAFPFFPVLPAAKTVYRKSYLMDARSRH